MTNNFENIQFEWDFSTTPKNATLFHPLFIHAFIDNLPINENGDGGAMNDLIAKERYVESKLPPLKFTFDPVTLYCLISSVAKSSSGSKLKSNADPLNHPLCKALQTDGFLVKDVDFTTSSNSGAGIEVFRDHCDVLHKGFEQFLEHGPCRRIAEFKESVKGNASEQVNEEEEYVLILVDAAERRKQSNPEEEHEEEATKFSLNSWQRRIQFLLHWYIDGASVIDAEDDERWDLFWMLRKRDNALVGYCSVYRFFKFERGGIQGGGDKSNSALVEEDQLPLGVRARISQFMVLAPFQGQGLGKLMYLNVQKHYRESDHLVKEITVEDQSEAFEKLRSSGDKTIVSQYLAKRQASLNKGEIERNTLSCLAILQEQDEKQLLHIAKELKLLPRQVRKALERIELDQLTLAKRAISEKIGSKRSLEASEIEDNMRALRLIIKKRIYIENKESVLDGLSGKRQKYEAIQRLYEEEFKDLLGYSE